MKNKTLTIIALTGLAASTVSLADGWYTGLGFNENAVRKDMHLFVDVKDITTEAIYKLKNGDIGFNLMVGKRSGRYANEVGIEKLGNLKWKNNESSLKINKISHIYYDGYFYMPIMLPRYEVFAKGGISYISKNFNNTMAQRFTLNYGTGVEVDLNKVKLRGSYTKVISNGSNDNLDAFSDSIGIDLIANIG